MEFRHPLTEHGSFDLNKLQMKDVCQDLLFSCLFKSKNCYLIC